MSDDYHRPTLTFPKGGYNASQVRLYGIVGKDQKHSKEVADGQPQEFTVESGDFTVKVSVVQGGGGGSAEFVTLVEERQKAMLYASFISIEMKKLGTVIMTATMTRQLAERTGGKISCGVIVGYAYEGHTYDLPKPKIMILPVQPEAKIPEDDSGYDDKENEGYAVWLVDKLDECAEFEMTQGFIEQLVLDANLPGKRAPNMYVGRMMLGHRGGKLSE